MDLAAISNFIPLGGASVLLVYLLRLISYERGRWIRERATLIEECKAELTRKDQEFDRHEREYDRYIAQLRERYDVLRADYDRLIELHSQREQERKQ